MIIVTKWKETEIGKIPEDWDIKRLGEITDTLTGFPFKSNDYSLIDGTLVVRGENLSERQFRWDKPKRWRTMNHFIEKYFLRENLAILAMDGNVGKNKAITKKEDLPLLLAQRVAAVIAKRGECQEFINQILMSDLFLKYCQRVKTGTTIAHISKEQIEDFIIPYPKSGNEQYSIAKIFSNLDSKIELNNQMNVTLKAMAQSLFKHWFIDFEFPNEKGDPYKSSRGRMVDSEKANKNIPSGWFVEPIDKSVKFLNGLALQKYPARSGDRYLPVIKIRELKQGITESSDKANLSVPKEYIIEDGDILFSWSGSLEVIVWTFGKGALNQHLFKVTSDEYPKWFYYYWILEYLSEYRAIAEGKTTTMGHIQRQHLTNSIILVPDKITLAKMNRVFNPIMEKLIQIGVESNRLSNIRDSLLPKLMSGKIRVPLES